MTDKQLLYNRESLADEDRQRLPDVVSSDDTYSRLARVLSKKGYTITQIEDAVSKARIRALMYLHKFDPTKSSLISWLCLLAIREAVPRNRTDSEVVGFEYEPASLDPDPVAQAESNLRIKEYKKAIQKQMGTKWRFFVQNTLKTTSTTEAARDAGFDPDSDEFNNGLLRVREILREYVPEEML